MLAANEKFFLVRAQPVNLELGCATLAVTKEGSAKLVQVKVSLFLKCSENLLNYKLQVHIENLESSVNDASARILKKTHRKPAVPIISSHKLTLYGSGNTFSLENWAPKAASSLKKHMIDS